MTLTRAHLDPASDAGARVYGRLRELFDAALEQPQAGLDAWIDASVVDPAERAALRRLLAADTGDGALDLAASERAARIGESDYQPDGLVGTRIGAFRLVRLLGQGGMSAVFLGERDDPQFRQQVAVKLLRRGLYGDVEQRLFQRERRTLATLSHPNIAHLIDGGVTAAGVPYLVLEYVDGVPITQYAATHALDLRARLRLFASVCRAVAAAHRILVVHRDLKPANVLVDREGRAKLLDFGIAKLLDDADEHATRAGTAALTPGYAAPEQHAGGVISTATDVYALGVMLHELLLGRRPRDADDATRRPSSRIGTDAATQPPASLPSRTLRAALRGDLDTLLMKAMATEPERRYASAAELADDVDRHLASQPVIAHPPSRGYRLRKFVQRHRGGVALAAAFTLGLLASLGLTLWQAREARQQAQRAAEVQAFVEEMFQPIEDGSALSGAPTLHQLLQRGAEQIDRRYPDDLAVRADLLALFARLRDGIGEADGIRGLALDAWRANVAAYGEDDARSRDARLLHARVLRQVGELDASLAEYRAVLVQMRRLGVGGQALARVLDSISIVRMAQGIDADEAIALKREVLDERLADPSASVDDVITGYNNLGAAYQYGARFDDALAWYRKAFDLGIATNGDHRVNANTLANIGAVQSYQGRWRLAADSLQRAREMYARIPIERSANLASLLLRQCMVLGLLERHADARVACDAAVEMTREVQGASHLQHALALARRAGAHVAAGRMPEAEAGYAAARALIGDGAGSASAARIVGADQARYWAAISDWAALRDAAMAVLDQPASRAMPYPGTRSPSAPMLGAWIALACSHAPSQECGNDRVARGDAILADPAFAHSAYRFGAALALARVDLERGAAQQALARLDASLPWGAPDLSPSHAWRAEWHLRRAQALRELARGADAGAEQQRAADLIDALPEGHPLRDLVDARPLR